MPVIEDTLPNLYKHLLPELFREEIPEETKATCANCAMCAESCQSVAPVESRSSMEAQRFFSPDTKCCTYHPSLPNFLVGAILDDERAEMAEGRRRVLEKIRNREGANPLGLSAPPKYNLFYQNTREFFGRSKNMLCPFYVESEAGNCSIWAYRESVCSTYFCKHVAGASGRKFWSQLKSYLALVEVQLSRHAIFELMPEFLLEERQVDGHSRPLSIEDLENRGTSDVEQKRLWGSWVGLEIDFYRECHALVESMSETDLSRVVGLDGQVSLKLLEKRKTEMLTPKLPARLKFNPDTKIEWLEDGSVAFGAYSELDALALPGTAYDLLKEFRGDKSVDDVRGVLREKHSSDFSPEVLTSLFQHRVLIEN